MKLISRLPGNSLDAGDVSIVPERPLNKVAGRVRDIEVELPHTGAPKHLFESGLFML